MGKHISSLVTGLGTVSIYMYIYIHYSKHKISLFCIIISCRQRDTDNSADMPDIEYTYTDSDTLDNELAELYSYSEVPELIKIKEIFDLGLQSRYKTTNWIDLTIRKQKSYMHFLLERCELVSCEDRLNALRSFLYLAHGNFMYGLDEADIFQYSRANVFMMIKVGVFQTAIDLLALEKEIPPPNLEGGKGKLTITDNVTLRICLSLLYVIVEVMRHEDNLDMADEDEIRKTFLRDLNNPVHCDDNLTAFLFRMLLNFCNGSMPHYPIRKILLLLWKTILASLGGMDELTKLKHDSRTTANLPPTFDETKPCRPDIFPTAAYDPRGNVSSQQGDNSQLPGLISRPVSIANDTDCVINFGEEKGLDFRPKAHIKDVSNFIETCRSKFCCYNSLSSSTEETMTADVSDLPQPVQESIRILRDHVYVPLSEIQISIEEEMEKQRSMNEKVTLIERDTPTESLYKSLLPNLPQYMIAILKVLLAAAPTSKSKNESLNIFVDVVPADTPANMMESAQNSIDINRHKEIIVKAISATLLLLLKHLKNNHIYQFEFVGQHLVFANCIPLVLKFFNQNVTQYVTLRNNLPGLNFPSCVLIPPAESKTIDVADGLGMDANTFCWRNVFSCINLVRILQKLTKWKHSRTVMLVVFRSSPILKRALKVRHPMMQLYVLKLLKVQTKYLGRNWRKTNMKIISAIYRKVRHHLHDDWAYGNDPDAKPWDFQTEEFALKNCVERFNTRYYDTDQTSSDDNPFGLELEQIDTNYLSVLGEQTELSKEWKENYEQWLEVEVFQHPIDWDNFLDSPTRHLDIKPLDV